MDITQTLQTLVDTLLGQPNVGDTPQNLGECVGLIEKWIDTLGFPHIWGNAIDLLTNADTNFYQVILNAPDNHPQAGDILVLGAPYGVHVDETGNTQYNGHTGIVINANLSSVTLFEQNDPLGTPPHMQNYNYSAVKGWIRPLLNTTTQALSITGIDAHGLDLNNPASMQVAIDTWYAVANGEYKTLEQYQTLETQFQVLQKQAEENSKVSDTTSSDLKSYREMQALGYNTIDDITKKISERDTAAFSLQTENTQLLKRIDVLSGEIQNSAKEDHTTADLGQAAIDENTQLKQALLEVAKVAGAEKINKDSIIKKIFSLRDLAEAYIKHRENQQQSSTEQEISQVEKTVSEVTPKTSDLISQLFNLLPKKGGV